MAFFCNGNPWASDQCDMCFRYYTYHKYVTIPKPSRCYKSMCYVTSVVGKKLVALRVCVLRSKSIQWARIRKDVSSPKTKRVAIRFCFLYRWSLNPYFTRYSCVVMAVNCKRLLQSGHVASEMGETKNAYRIFMGKLRTTRWWTIT